MDFFEDVGGAQEASVGTGAAAGLQFGNDVLGEGGQLWCGGCVGWTVVWTVVWGTRGFGCAGFVAHDILFGKIGVDSDGGG